MKVHLLDSASLETISVSCTPAVIGRDAEADVQLADSLLAPFHCMLGLRDDSLLHAWRLRDDACTLINGRPIVHAKVLPGDRLTVGGTEFVVEYELPHRRPPAGRDPRAVRAAATKDSRCVSELPPARSGRD